MRAYHTRPRRSGTVLVLTAFMMVAMFALLAFAVDLGYLHVVQSELQRSSDAAALAATWELIDENSLTGTTDPAAVIESARSIAGQYGGLNVTGNIAPALAAEDVVIGYLSDPSNPEAQMCFDDPSRYNAVQISVRRTAEQNGEVPLFFARVLGFDGNAQHATATAAFVNNFGGFGLPSSGENLDLLPFALDLQTWNGLLAGTGTDDWTWDPEAGQVFSGSDGILEVNLFPQSTGSPGNRGTVDIGSNNNSTADIARQIVHGISEDDLDYHGGSLEFDENGELELNGDTGISAGVKDELDSIKGETRIIPIFSQVSGPGNNAQYTIGQVAGIRIMEVKLTGKMSSKRVIIQPANMTVCGGIPSSGAQASYFIHSPVWLVR